MAKRIVRLLEFSDTHTFYDGSRHKNGLSPETIKELAQYDYVVRAGDIYDFHYFFHLLLKEYSKDHSRDEIFPDEIHLHPEVKERLKAAIDEGANQTKQLIEACPNTVLIDLMGNHDAARRYGEKLDGLMAQYPKNFIWDAESVRIGKSYFTHGDLVLRKQNISKRETYTMTSYAHAKTKLWAERNIHDILQLTVFYFWNHKKILFPRFHKLLEARGDELSQGSEYRFLGHVHVTPDANFMHKGISYNHSGASTYNRKQLPIEMVLEIDDNDKNLAPNYLFPNARVLEVKQVYIEGLTHADKSYVEMIKHQRSFQRISSQIR